MHDTGDVVLIWCEIWCDSLLQAEVLKFATESLIKKKKKKLRETPKLITRNKLQS